LKKIFKTFAKNRINGFTIVEALLAVLFVFIFSIGIISMMVYTRRFTEIENERVAALTMASERMEQIKRDVFSSIVGSMEDVVIDDGNTPNDPGDDLHGTMQVIVKSKTGETLYGPPPDENRIYVEILVTWRPPGRISDAHVLEERLISELAP